MVAMISANEYEAFRYASSYGHLLILQALYDWSSEEEIVAMISAKNYFSFRHASVNRHYLIAQALYNWSSEAERVVMVSVLQEKGIRNIITDGDL